MLSFGFHKRESGGYRITCSMVPKKKKNTPDFSCLHVFPQRSSGLVWHWSVEINLSSQKWIRISENLTKYSQCEISSNWLHVFLHPFYVDASASRWHSWTPQISQIHVKLFQCYFLLMCSKQLGFRRTYKCSSTFFPTRMLTHADLQFYMLKFAGKTIG